ncbi:MAG: DUF507 family protein [Sulfurospirillaceae bacterium]|nr:DUF507 family protein [Sulfurospirillaceae bacterium]MCK9546357.1 DUF507 family protein [Sulfurospirillaceae bacterium]MDY0237376.1 DUF507 family protein [Campylobacterales bacterium]
MKVRMPHTPYIANKIALDLLNSGFVTLNEGLDAVVKVAQEFLVEDVQKELSLDERVNEILEENEDDIEFMQVDRRNMFWLVKKKLAKEYNFTLSREDRYNDLSHQILEAVWKKSLIEYSVSENRVKNIIYNAIESYLKTFEGLEDIVIEKLSNYKRKLIPGSAEYDLIFEKLYEEELRKKGMLQ